jgi:hypothetical protein
MPLDAQQQVEAARIISALDDLYPNKNLTQILQDVPVVIVPMEGPNRMGWNQHGEYIAIVEPESNWVFCVVLTHEYMHSVLKVTTGSHNDSHKDFPFGIQYTVCKDIED